MELARLEAVAVGSSGSPYYMAHHVQYDPATIEEAASLFAEWLTGVSTYMHVNNTWQVQGEVPIFDDAVGTITGVATVGPFTPIPGDNTGAVLPTQVQGLVTWQTNVYVNGRNIKGRSYLPAMCEAFSNGALEPAPQAAITSLSATYVADLEANNSRMRIWSRKNLVSAPVLTGSCAQVFATLRSRGANS